MTTNKAVFKQALEESLEDFKKELEAKKGNDVLKTYLYVRFAEYIGTNVTTLRRMLKGNFENMQLKKLGIVLENLGIEYRFMK